MNDSTHKPKLKLRLHGTGPEQTSTKPTAPWPVLVVDDDPGIHEMSRVLLRDFEFQGRSFSVISAYSAAQALPLLAAHPDLPLVLLDVVMEHEQAGLELVRQIRQELGNHSIRIVLRTGYPGQAPERQVMLDYDINDYRTKSELTANQLFTAMVGALRSWLHITTIEQMNHALEKRVAERTMELAAARAFADHILNHVPAPMWVRDQEGQIIHINRAYGEFFHPDGTCPPNLLPPPHHSIQQETDLHSPTQGTRTVLFQQHPLPRLDFAADTAAVGGCIGLLTDISDRKRLEAELHHLAITDPLTGCYNRRHFLTKAGEVHLSNPQPGSFSILLLDIDHFKRVNDTHGHLVGDDVLRQMVRTCQFILPPNHLLARFGGEEFAILAPGNLDHATQLAENLRAAVSASPLPLAAGSLPVTISIGVTENLCVSEQLDHMLARADSALYRAKGGGRNCVVSLAG